MRKTLIAFGGMFFAVGLMLSLYSVGLLNGILHFFYFIDCLESHQSTSRVAQALCNEKADGYVASLGSTDYWLMGVPLMAVGAVAWASGR